MKGLPAVAQLFHPLGDQHAERLMRQPPLEAVGDQEEFFATRKDPLLAKIRNKAALDAEIEAELKTAADEWKLTLNA